MRDLSATLRRDEIVSGDVVVVRGGLDTSAKILGHAEDLARRFTWRGAPAVGVSAFGSRIAAINDVLSDKLVSYPKYRLAQVGALREAGFEVLPTFVAPHVTIVLPDLDDKTLDRLLDTFGPVRDNLEYRRRRNRRHR